MKRTLLGLSIVLAVVLSTSVVQADSTVIVGSDMYFGNWSGGAVTAYATGNSNFPSFDTFCAYMQGVLYVNGGSGYTYQVTGLGNVNAAGTPLSVQTAYLFTGFTNGTLPGYTGAVLQQEAVQYGIWNSLGCTDAQLQAEGSSILQGNLAAAEAEYLSMGWNVTPGTWSGYGNVQIALLTSLSGNNPAQDILVMTDVVPEPAAMGLLGLGLGGLLVMRRRKA
jgi:hypothetical protein